MKTLHYIVMAGLLLAGSMAPAQVALEPEPVRPSDAVRLLPAPPAIKPRVKPVKGKRVWWTSPGPHAVVFRPGAITLDWNGSVPAGTTYSVSMSQNGKTFDTPVAERLSDSHLRWDVPDIRRTTFFLRVKATSPDGQFIGQDTVRVQSVPANAIVVSKKNQVLWAFQDGLLRQRYLVSTGAIDHDTRAGWFSVYSRQVKHRSTLYDVEMPYALFFSGGQAIHASTALRQLGSPASHGCVRLPRRHARALFDASVIGRPVIITDWREDMSWLDGAPRQRAAPPAAVKRASAPATATR